MPTKTCGAEEARAHLSELIERAHRGQATIITRHGKPYAAVVPADRSVPMPRTTALLALKGTGKGLWGTKSARTVAALRDEWS